MGGVQTCQLTKEERPTNDGVPEVPAATAGQQPQSMMGQKPQCMIGEQPRCMIGQQPQCMMGGRQVDDMSFMISCTNWY